MKILTFKKNSNPREKILILKKIPEYLGYTISGDFLT